jgi:hypothetical protein
MRTTLAAVETFQAVEAVFGGAKDGRQPWWLEEGALNNIEIRVVLHGPNESLPFRINDLNLAATALNELMRSNLQLFIQTLLATSRETAERIVAGLVPADPAEPVPETVEGEIVGTRPKGRRRHDA